MTNYPHAFSPMNKAQPAQPPAQKKMLTMEEKIDKIFFRTATLEKDVAQLLHANGMESTNKFLNNS